MRDFVRRNLARSLATSQDEARLAAAWTAACGRAMAAHASISSYDPATATVRILVSDSAWLEPLTALRSKLTRDLASLSGLPVRDLRFEPQKKA